MITKNYDQQIVKEIIKELDLEISSKREYILNKVGKFFNKNNYTFQQFNGVFGGKNNIYVDSIRTQFLDFEDFYAKWLQGLIDEYEKEKQFQLEKYGYIRNENAAIRNLKIIQDKEIEAYVRIFLERNFYRKLDERLRHKPDEKLWAIWFGNELVYGLLIAPKKRGNEWVNDKKSFLFLLDNWTCSKGRIYCS